MGDYKSHKADHPSHGHCSRRQEGPHSRNNDPQEVHIDPQAGSHFVPQLEDIGTFDAAGG